MTQVAEKLHAMADSAVTFDEVYREFQRLKQYSETDFMMGHYDPNAVKEKGVQLTKRLMTPRNEFMRHIHDVSLFCQMAGIPYVWKVYPPPAFGGYVRSQNVFESFIDLNIESDERPNLLQITDLLQKALLFCERQMKAEAEDPPSMVGDRLRAVPRHVGAVLSWLFPTEKQRGVLGWVLIAGLVALILRYLFGLHLEDLGKLLTKWFTK
jgi:hypothetical protein